MNQNNIKIISDGTPIGTKVFVDGKQLTSCVSVAFSIGTDGLPKATLVVYADEIEVDGPAELTTHTK